MIMGAMMTDIMKSSLIHSLSSIPYGRSNNCIAIIHTQSTLACSTQQAIKKCCESQVVKLWTCSDVLLCLYHVSEFPVFSLVFDQVEKRRIIRQSYGWPNKCPFVWLSSPKRNAGSANYLLQMFLHLALTCIFKDPWNTFANFWCSSTVPFFVLYLALCFIFTYSPPSCVCLCLPLCFNVLMSCQRQLCFCLFLYLYFYSCICMCVCII